VIRTDNSLYQSLIAHLDESSENMTSRNWEKENVSYYDYSPDELKKDPEGRDAQIVAEAYIYSDDRKYNIVIRVEVSGLDLLSGITRENAVNQGITVRYELVRQYKDEAKLLRENRLILRRWNGERVE
jgi:hypothetical protein